MSITQTLTSAPALPDRLDKVNFSGQVATYLSWESTSRGELINWTTQANALAAQCDADAVTSQEAQAVLQTAISVVSAAKWNASTVYAIDNVLIAPDYNAYRVTNIPPAGDCPCAYNKIARTSTANHYLYKTYTTTSHANKTYTFRVRMWLGTLSDTIKLILRDGADVAVGVSTKTVTAGIDDYTVTGTFGASPAANIRVYIDPSTDSGGTIGQWFGVEQVELYESSDMTTNLLSSPTNITDWTIINCSVTFVSPSAYWKKIDALPDKTGNSGKILGTDGTTLVWLSHEIVYKTSSGSWTATSTTAKVTVVGGGKGGGAGGGTGGTTSFAGTSTVSASSATSSGGDISFNGVPATSPNSLGFTQVGGVSIVGGQYGQGGVGSPLSNAGNAGITSVKYYNNLVIGTSYTCTVGAGGEAGGGGAAGSAGLIIIET